MLNKNTKGYECIKLTCKDNIWTNTEYFSTVTVVRKSPLMIFLTSPFGHLIYVKIEISIFVPKAPPLTTSLSQLMTTSSLQLLKSKKICDYFHVSVLLTHHIQSISKFTNLYLPCISNSSTSNSSTSITLITAAITSYWIIERASVWSPWL